MIILDYTLQLVIIGTTLLGITAGTLSSFVFLRKQSLLGDAISHAALPGIILACLLTGKKDPATLMLGATIAGIIGTSFIRTALAYTSIKSDTILGLVLSVFFGCGLVLISILKKYPALQAHSLQKFLFGNAASFTPHEIYLLAAVSLCIIVCIALCWKEFKIVSFDSDFAFNSGLSVHRVDILFTLILIITIIIGLQTVGVILMSTMLIAPGAAARQWTQRIESMALLSACFGACACIAGSCMSSLYSHIPTGPTIVIVLSTIVFCSLFGAPTRKKNRQQVSAL
jgi:manganese/zinc/iron transport system permease protein